MVEAYKWLQLADKGGDQEAKTQMEAVAAELTKQQITTANSRTQRWLKEHPDYPET
jgi:hypothetical protein